MHARNRSPALPDVDLIVPVSDFPGLINSDCALAKAPAKAAIDWLDRCMVYRLVTSSFARRGGIYAPRQHSNKR